MLAAFARGKAAKVVSGGVARLTSRTPGAVQTAVPVPTALARTTLGERLAERLAERLGAVLAAEREALPLWLPVAFAAGIAAWFVLPRAEQRLAAALLLVALAAAAGLARLRLLAIPLLLMAAGMGTAAWRSASVAHPVLAERTIVGLTGRVESVDLRPDRDQVRLLLAPDAGSGLPPRLRLTLRGGVPAGIAPGARIAVRAALAPPAAAAVPGGYDFARRAWFAGIGATGFALGTPVVTEPAPPPPGPVAWLDAARRRLTAHIRTVLPGEAGAVAAAFVTGDQGAIPLATAQAMRDAGLAHLLSISGLHIAVVVGGVMFLLRRLLALSPWAALHLPLRALAAGGGAAAGLVYTLLAGAEVPTVRTIIATLVVLAGILIGREALSLRSLGLAAVLILAIRPEALVGASFQLSFAAVIAIVALYESRLGRWLTTAGEDEHPLHRLGRRVAALVVSGLVAEAALSSIGLFHFNRAGLYGALANLVAIPLSSFVIMPLLVAALLADLCGLAWLWPPTGLAIEALIGLARATAGLPAAVVRLGTMPTAAFALIVAGGLWLALWRTRWRWFGAPVALAGLLLALLTPPADLLISGDGRQVAVRQPDGRLAFVRPRVSDYLREMWGEAVAAPDDGTEAALPGLDCSPDVCLAPLPGGRRLLLTLSRDFIARPRFEPACAAADIVVSDRCLPAWCRPRWLKLDRPALAASGAVAITLAGGRVASVGATSGDHPWRPPPATAAPRHLLLDGNGYRRRPG